MNWTALTKVANSSKVLIFLIFATAITVACWQGWVVKEWWQSAIETAFYMLMGGYSLVEIARAIATGRKPHLELPDDHVDAPIEEE